MPPLHSALLATLVAWLVHFSVAESVEANEPRWQSHRVHDRFLAEGASAGDIDGDGQVDLVAGALWFRGPDFTESFEIAPVKEFSVAGYGDQFMSHVADFDGDGANDVLVIGFPGTPARLYLNPGHEALRRRESGKPWVMHEVTGPIDNESPAIVDLIPGGLPEIVCGNQSQYGYYAAGDDATRPWIWNPVTRADACSGRFAHGLGVGDLNGDGRLDLIDMNFWWEQPADVSSGAPWPVHRWSSGSLGPGGAQICVGDVDGDGDADIVTSLHAHGYGLAWFEQLASGEFVRHEIMGESSLDNPYGVAFSQLHAVALEDIDGDGVADIVTGKRWMAHNGKDRGALQDPVLYWFRCERRDGAVEFIPHLIDDDSGVGVDILVTDLNGDSLPDIVSSSKRGLSIHWQVDESVADQRALRPDAVPERWNLSEGRDQGTYADGFSPADAAKNMLVPEGFTVDLVASEPELTQPIAMCFDDRGRLWVVEGHTYPQKAAEGQGRDRILILEDTDADGHFEKSTVFYEGLNLVSGIEVGFGGVWVGAAPELLFIPDANRDDVPDSEPIVMLDGWGYQDTHETLNSFTWGPDGWLYGCQGVFTHSLVGRPGATQDERTAINAGVWRFHPTQHRFEVFAHGTSNPWGVDFNDQGDWFISACVIPHLYHVVQGGRYQRQAGQHFNEYTYDDLKTIADHAHYAGSIREHAYWGENKESLPEAPLETSLVGGGHAHCGLAIYNADIFPRQYYGDLFFHNLHGHRVVRERVARDGSAYVGQHRPDFALAQDHKQVGVGIMVGPDGALYTSDWHDIQTCHNRVSEVWDRTDGRIFRIRYGALQPFRFDLGSECDAQLVARLDHGNGFFARQAQRLLQERAAAGVLDRRLVQAELEKRLEPTHDRRTRLRALWAKHVAGLIDDAELVHWMHDGDEFIRGWAVHFVGQRMGDQGSSAISPQVFDQLSSLAEQDPSLVVRRYLASLLGQLSAEQRVILIKPMVTHAISAHDHNIPLLVWYALEPLVAEAPGETIEMTQESSWRELFRFVVRRTTESASGREELVRRLADPNFQRQRLIALEELDAASLRRGKMPMPKAWPDAYALLADARLPEVRNLARSVAVQFGDRSVLPFFRETLADASQPAAERQQALAILLAAGDENLVDRLLPLLDDPAVSARVTQTLAATNDPRVPEALLSRMDSFDDETRTHALSTLVSRATYARALVKSMDDGRVAPESVPAFIVRQIVGLDDPQLTARLEKTWGRIATSSQEQQALYAKYRAILRPRAIAGANASNGRVLYEANCGNCHKLFGNGGDIGPDITGADRTKVDYWLENILEPNALIGRGYQMTTFLTTSGRVINGIVKAENEDAVTVQTATELIVIPQDEIEIAKLTTTSLMPEGQLEPMSETQVLDLFKYLTSPTQVPLPKK